MKRKLLSRPTAEQIEAELNRRRNGKTIKDAASGTIWTLVIVAAITILCATLWMPILQIYGTSMTPTFQNGDIVASIKSGHFESGEVVAFYYNNKILVKRVIAVAGDWVNIDGDGTVYVNNVKLDESYLAEKDSGTSDIEYPYQVPEGCGFVLGDHRQTSIDSRSSMIGSISVDQIVGKVVFRVWPLSGIGPIE